MTKERRIKNILTYILLIVIICISFFVMFNRFFYDNSGVEKNPITLKLMFEWASDLIGVCVIASFVMACISGKRADTMGNRAFVRLLIIIMLMMLIDLCSYIVEGYNGEKMVLANYIFTSLEYVFNGLSIFVFAQYLYTQNWVHEKRTKNLKKVTTIFIAIILVMFLSNIWWHYVFTIEEGKFKRGVGIVVINTITEILLIGSIFCLDIKKIDATEVFVVLFYILIPTITNLIRFFYSEIDFMFFGILMSACILFVQGHMRQERMLVQEEIENEENKTKIMLSQIKPHFLYNTLNSIASLCLLDSERAVETIADFSDYLRGNMDAISGTDLISIEKEIEHTKKYTHLEELRFADRLKIEYNISISSVSLPALTIATLVENAIKHGVCQRAEGGKVEVSTREDERNSYVEIKDNGIGFDKEEVAKDGKKHYGIAVVEKRLRVLCNGRLEIESEKGTGTKVTIVLPKEKRK